MSPDILIGYCQSCNLYTEFDKVKHKWSCGKCDGRFSSKNGEQITTRRSWNGRRGKVTIKDSEMVKK